MKHKEHREAVRLERGYKTGPAKAKCLRCDGKPLPHNHRKIVKQQREAEARLVQQAEAERKQHENR